MTRDDPALVERWDELNDGARRPGRSGNSWGRSKGTPDGVWMALDGFAAIEPEIRPEIVAGLGPGPPRPGTPRVPPPPPPSGATSPPVTPRSPGPFGRRRPTPRGPGGLARHRRASPRRPGVVSAAQRTGRRRRRGVRRRCGVVARAGRARSSRRSTGKGQGRIVLSGSRKGRRASAVFVCDVERGLIEVAGEVEPDGAGSRRRVGVRRVRRVDRRRPGRRGARPGARAVWRGACSCPGRRPRRRGGSGSRRPSDRSPRSRIPPRFPGHPACPPRRPRTPPSECGSCSTPAPTGWTTPH